MGQIHRLKRAALSILPAQWVPPVAARAALVLDEVELHLLEILCRRAGTSVDVGANLGIYTEILRRNSRAVVAVEPHPALAKHLRRAFRHGVRVVEAALSDAPAVTNIRIPVMHGREVDTRGSLELAAMGDFQTISRQVDVLTLDMLNIHDVGFIKIDVEGHEREVVDGGMRLLEARHPRLLIELEERHRSGSVEQMVGRLSPLAGIPRLLRAGSRAAQHRAIRRRPAPGTGSGQGSPRRSLSGLCQQLHIPRR